ncbi:MAG TPA: hypothetical protein VJC17_02235 [Candidatus Dojkabacteria bacterium]|nr:hypothetical protein [Candidatus Dojkabacteria bacterium]
MKNVFVINGLPGTGKTLFGNLVKAGLTKLKIPFLHTSSIDLVKHLLMPQSQWDKKMVPVSKRQNLIEAKKKITLKDWDGLTKDIYWRKVMSDYKKAINNLYPKLIHSWILKKINSLEDNSVIFIDIREIDQIIGFVKFCKNKSLNIKTINVESDVNDLYDNISDASVMTYIYDIYLYNYRKKYQNNQEDSLNALKLEVSRFINKYIKNY